MERGHFRHVREEEPKSTLGSACFILRRAGPGNIMVPEAGDGGGLREGSFVDDVAGNRLRDRSESDSVVAEFGEDIGIWNPLCISSVI